jgi:hypothetical protein
MIGDTPLIAINGATRLHAIVGDPIHQVKSPGGLTQAFAREGLNAVLIPMKVSANDLATALIGIDRIANLEGIVVTLPHKLSCYAHCALTSDRSARVGAVNVMRRARDGGWYGDLLDGGDLSPQRIAKESHFEAPRQSWWAREAQDRRSRLPCLKRESHRSMSSIGMQVGRLPSSRS